MTLHRPTTLEDALGLIGEGAVVLGGGTDVYPALRDGVPPATMVDVTRIDGLRGVSRVGAGWRIGAATTWTDILRADLPPAFDGLKLAAREVGSVQIQNAGTVAGNICNASPAADGVPALLVLGAEVELAGPSGVRQLALSEFILGPRRTALEPGELVVALHVPNVAGRGGFLKLGARKYLVISIAMVAVVVELDAGLITGAKIAVGACSPVALRLPGLEAALKGAAPDAIAGVVAATDLPGLSPIDDVRASAAYRQDAVRTLITRTLLQALEPADVA
ncbi:FAD binding domain-containing protein [Pseudooceanicola sp. C21-150M6]|uniref:FAD binding domain-containing protein n=1 Tax=Pseudooceanicola sp. C21-150M6 TaxID=3434355 RepID=UPI003D7F97C8